MSDFILRPMMATDLAAILDVQAQCYGSALLEGLDALASRLTLSSATCWVAEMGNKPDRLGGYLFTHPWSESSLPPLDSVLERHRETPPAQTTVTWFVHDMAVAPAGRGSGLAIRLYKAALAEAVRAGLRRSRLIAVQSAGDWWRRLGYVPVGTELTAAHAAKLERYGADAVIMERSLAG